MDTIHPLTVEVHCALVSSRYPWLKRCNERIVEAVIDLIEAKAREEEEKGLDTLYVLQNASGWTATQMTRSDFCYTFNTYAPTYTDFVSRGEVVNGVIEFTDRTVAVDYLDQLLEEGDITEEQYDELVREF